MARAPYARASAVTRRLPSAATSSMAYAERWRTSRTTSAGRSERASSADQEADDGAEQRREAVAGLAGNDERQARRGGDPAPHQRLTRAHREPVQRSARQVRIDSVLVDLRVVLHPDRHRHFEA